jgi:two-component system, NarL family, nitrate/nitrite response regulator NarL
MNDVSTPTGTQSRPEGLGGEYVSVLIVDVVHVVGEVLAKTLMRQQGFTEIRCVSDKDGVRSLLRAFHPDVALLNAMCPDALATFAEVRSALPDLRVIAMAVGESEEEILACAEVGAAGFLTRDATLEDVVRALSKVAQGEAVCPQSVARALLRRISTDAHQRSTTTDSLTPREREVLVLIEHGLSNKQIAQRLGIEVRTVKNHVHNLFAKLRVQRRGEAAARLRSARVPALDVLRTSDLRLERPADTH